MKKLDFIKVYNENLSKVYNRVNHYVKNSDTVNLLTSEIMMKLYNNIDDFDSEKAQLTTWLMKITNNHCIDYLRKNKNSQNVIKVDSFVDSEGKEFFQFVDNNHASDNIENNELKAKIDIAFQTLKPEFKVVAELLFIEGKNYDEIVNKTGFSLSNVKVIVHRVRTVLQSELKTEYANL